MDVSESSLGVILLDEELEVSEICGDEPARNKVKLRNLKAIICIFFVFSYPGSHRSSCSRCQSGLGSLGAAGRAQRGEARSTCREDNCQRYGSSSGSRGTQNTNFGISGQP